MNSKRKTSVIWNFFTVKSETLAKCNFCSQVLSYKTSITNLRHHVVKKHPSVRIQDQTKSSVPNKNPDVEIQFENIAESSASEKTDRIHTQQIKPKT